MNEGTQCIIDYHYLREPFVDAPLHKVYGLIYQGKIVGVTSYSAGHLHPDNWLEYYGLDKPRDNVWDLTRLVVGNETQDKEHNITSWFASRTIKLLQPSYIVTCADSSYHDGTIYAAMSMDYHGLQEGRLIKEGVMWHTFTKSYDKTIKCIWEKKTFDKC